jgi:hypothetical protein
LWELSRWVDLSKVDFMALLPIVGGALAVYLLVSLLLFKAAKKRGGRSWLAWVPVVQIAVLFSRQAAVSPPPLGLDLPGLGLSDEDLSGPGASSEEETALDVDLGGTGPAGGGENPFEFDLPSEEPLEEEKPEK